MTTIDDAGMAAVDRHGDAHAPLLTPGRAPPPDYYRDNLMTVLDFVLQRDGPSLARADATVLRGLRAAGADAQRLYARLLGRTLDIVRLDKLAYAEIEDLSGACTALATLGLLDTAPVVGAETLLRLVTRAELAELFELPRGASKQAMLQRLPSRHTDRYITGVVAAAIPFVRVTGRALADRVCRLFFGDARQDLSTFVLRDLGVTRFEHVDLERASAFPAPGSFQRYLSIAQVAGLTRRVDEFPHLATELLDSLWREDAQLDTPLHNRVRGRALLRLARWHERRGEFDAALACYGCTRLHPARERSVRVLHRIGDDVGVAARLAQIRQRASCAEELVFAQRFGRRGAGFQPPVTEIALHGPTPAHIERFAMRTLTANGGIALHLENVLPLGIAGLAYWDVVFAPVPGAFTNRFQSGPRDLWQPTFTEPREALLRQAETRLQDGQLAALLQRRLQHKLGIANQLVHWRRFDAQLLRLLLAVIPAPALRRLATHVIQHLHLRRTGFPDLFVAYAPGRYEFVEVKGPQDQLQPGQRAWLQTLAELALPARVLKFRA